MDERNRQEDLPNGPPGPLLPAKEGSAGPSIGSSPGFTEVYEGRRTFIKLITLPPAGKTVAAAGGGELCRGTDQHPEKPFRFASSTVRDGSLPPRTRLSFVVPTPPSLQRPPHWGAGAEPRRALSPVSLASEKPGRRRQSATEEQSHSTTSVPYLPRIRRTAPAVLLRLVQARRSWAWRPIICSRKCPSSGASRQLPPREARPRGGDGGNFLR